MIMQLQMLIITKYNILLDLYYKPSKPDRYCTSIKYKVLYCKQNFKHTSVI